MHGDEPGSHGAAGSRYRRRGGWHRQQHGDVIGLTDITLTDTALTDVRHGGQYCSLSRDIVALERRVAQAQYELRRLRSSTSQGSWRASATCGET